MPAEPPITTKAVILEVIDAHTCVAELPNGKALHAHLSRRRPTPFPLRAGATIALEMNPYDFSRGRIRSGDTDLEPNPE